MPTLWRLGPVAVLQAALYRLKLRRGTFVSRLPIRPFASEGNLFSSPVSPPSRVISDSADTLLAEARQLAAGHWTFFGRHTFELGSIPDWHVQPFTQERFAHPEFHWSRLPDFDPALGDIKGVWELSRMEWMIRLAQAYRLTLDPTWIERMNALLQDWLAKNPFNAGPQWKCGQETSLRALHLIAAHDLLGASAPTDFFIEVLRRHGERIEPSLAYARSQKNNHALSEAVGLYVIGAFTGEPHWERIGRNLIETTVAQLFERDGTFAQYSVVYHRFALDVLSYAQVWATKRGQPFSTATTERVAAAVRWLHRLTDPSNGAAPNLGANDGAQLFRWDASPARDFRSSVELASQLFLKQTAYGTGAWQEPLRWLGVPASHQALTETSDFFRDGGFYVLKSPRDTLTFRVPRFRFRPSQCDIFHIDLWLDHENRLRDGGSYSYASTEANAYFSGTVSHNSVQFDGEDSMPRLSRFLFGAWPGVRVLRADATEVAAEYRDFKGRRHRRTVQRTPQGWTIVDEIESARHEATLRWRLAASHPTELRNDQIQQGNFKISVVREDGPHTLALSHQHSESLHYLERTPLPVLEATARGPRIRWKTSISY